jgi:general secretion pathway protein M
MIIVRDWFGQRSQRERRMLLVMLAIGLPLLVWLALVVPMDRAYDRALERQLEAVDRHARILALAERAKAAPARRLPQIADLALFLTDNARQAGLIATPSAAPQPGSSLVTIASASAPAALEWLRQLEAAGHAVSDVRIAPGANGSVAVTATIGGGQ